VFKRAEIGAVGPSGTDRAYLDVAAARASLDIDARVGKVEKVEGGARKAGYNCTLCNLVFHDSAALLEHLNSRLHQGKLGFSMKIEQSTVKQVKSRLAQHLEEASAASSSQAPAGDSLEARIRQAEEEQQARKRARKEAKGAKQQQPPAELDEDAAQMLGFGAFGSSAKRR
jgi:U4/U6.U5 tri-snRNP component SNU23